MRNRHSFVVRKIARFMVFSLSVSAIWVNAYAEELATNFQFKRGNAAYSESGACVSDLGNFWNTIDIWEKVITKGGVDISKTEILHSDGRTSSRVTLSLTFKGAVSSFWNSKKVGGSSINGLTESYIFVTDSGSVEFLIEGLSQNRYYDIFLYGANGGYNCDESLFTVNGETVTISNKPQSKFEWVKRLNFNVARVKPDSSGAVRGIMTRGSAREGSFNGIQVIPVMTSQANRLDAN